MPQNKEYYKERKKLSNFNKSFQQNNYVWVNKHDDMFSFYSLKRKVHIKTTLRY